VATVQNPYALAGRSLDNGLDETMHRLGVSLLASPLAFGALTGKYDEGRPGRGRRARGRLSRVRAHAQ
jgi:aryl-alcohol dehydrogenase-like predicted oxidoreductase